MRQNSDVPSRERENQAVLLIFLLAVYLSGNLLIFCALYITAAVYMVLRTLYAGFRKREKVMLCTAYGVLLALQLVYAKSVVFVPGRPPVQHWLLRLPGVLAMALPLFVERFITANKNARFYLPSLEEVQAISFAELRENQEKLRRAMEDAETTARKLTPENLGKALTGSHGHSSITYVNHGSLTDAYFREAEAALSDPFLYIVISDTGSTASEIIGSVTQKVYNHASLSFDRGLKTTLSCNGGANLYPPGLNPEMVAHFHLKPDASVLVYRLFAGRRRKERVLETVRRINREGSAYNMLGLVTKWSYKPNIIFCSQFVYRMLQEAGLQYFDKCPGEVRPTDLVELDYRRKLEFVEEITFRQTGKRTGCAGPFFIHTAERR